MTSYDIPLARSISVIPLIWNPPVIIMPVWLSSSPGTEDTGIVRDGIIPEVPGSEDPGLPNIFNIFLVIISFLFIAKS